MNSPALTLGPVAVVSMLDQLVAAKHERIENENIRLKSEITQSLRAQGLPDHMHSEYLRKKELEVQFG
jgi:hypothetical protein